MSKRFLTTQQRNVLTLMAEDWTLVTNCPESGTERTIITNGHNELEISEWDMKALRRAPRLIRHLRTDAPARRLYYVRTPEGCRHTPTEESASAADGGNGK